MIKDKFGKEIKDIQVVSISPLENKIIITTSEDLCKPFSHKQIHKLDELQIEISNNRENDHYFKR